MTKKIKWISGILALVLVIGGAYLVYDKLAKDYAPDKLVKDNKQYASQTEDSSVSEDILPAPDFTVVDYDGKKVNLSDYIGKPIVLNFWASWCPPCKTEMPDFNEAYKKHNDVQFMMVNMTDGSRETVKSAKAYIEAKRYDFPVFFDTEYSAAIAYNVSSLPTTFFIDKNGNLIAHANSMIDAVTLEKGIDMLKE